MTRRRWPGNQVALEALVNTVIAAGGGTVYFPAGTYHFHTKKAPDKYVLDSRRPRRDCGSGRRKASRLIWNRNDGSGGAAHFFRFDDGFSQCVVEHLYFCRALTNPDRTNSTTPSGCPPPIAPTHPGTSSTSIS